MNSLTIYKIEISDCRQNTRAMSSGILKREHDTEGRADLFGFVVPAISLGLDPGAAGTLWNHPLDPKTFTGMDT